MIALISREQLPFKQALFLLTFLHSDKKFTMLVTFYFQKRREGGARGGGRPSNVLQDHVSNSPNSGVKISGGGGSKAHDLGNYNFYENKILQSCHLNCIFPRSVRH